VKIPGPIKGSVRVPIPKINIWLGMIGAVLAYAGMISGPWYLLSIGLGMLIVMPLAVGLHWFSYWRMDKKMKQWPVQVQVCWSRRGTSRVTCTVADGCDADHPRRLRPRGRRRAVADPAGRTRAC
jgi:hypothetical protein